MSSLICFLNKLAIPATGVDSDFALVKPAELGAAGNDVGLRASCSQDPGNKEEGECGKRLSDSQWASEDLSCRSQFGRDMETNSGTSEWTGAADSQRAISLDASECLAELSNPSGTSLVRSTALEDLTSIGDRNFVNQAEEIISEEIKEGEAADGDAFAPCDSRSQTTMSETLQAPQSLLQSDFDSSSEDVHPENTSDNERLFHKVPCDPGAENSSDSWPHRPSYSRPDICNESEMRSSVAQTTGTAELQKTPSQTSAARKSLVPVAVSKGLFALMFTSSEPALLS